MSADQAVEMKRRRRSQTAATADSFTPPQPLSLGEWVAEGRVRGKRFEDDPNCNFTSYVCISHLQGFRAPYLARPIPLSRIPIDFDALDLKQRGANILYANNSLIGLAFPSTSGTIRPS